MKKPIIILLTLTLFTFLSATLISCGDQTQKNAASEENQPELVEVQTAIAATFLCPMHPEEKGDEGDKCSKCGMDLEQVAAEASCPMHPEIIGKIGDKCSKCKMDLVAINQDAVEEPKQ